MPASPYWLDDAAVPYRANRHAGAVDVAVVGAGVTGCAAARRLAHDGLRVRLFDARGIAEGASGRNGGFALRGAPAPYDVTAASIGDELAKRFWARTEAAIGSMRELAGDAFRDTGSLRLAYDADEREELRREYDALAGAGFAADWVEEIEGPFAGRATGGIRHPTDGALQPARWVRRLAALASDAGVEIREHERVVTPEQTGADRVVVCTDGYPSGLLGELEGLIVPTRGQVVATEPIEERWYLTPHYGRHGFDYWHQTPDGRIVAGGFRDAALETEFTAVEETTPAIQAALESFVQTLAGRPLRIDYRWAGIFGLVLDFLPVVGRAPGDERLWVAGGYSGHGNVLGFACGELVADALIGQRDPLLDVLDPSRLLGGL